jgi:hypothetical protein
MAINQGCCHALTARVARIATAIPQPVLIVPTYTFYLFIFLIFVLIAINRNTMHLQDRRDAIRVHQGLERMDQKQLRVFLVKTDMWLNHCLKIVLYPI